MRSCNFPFSRRSSARMLVSSSLFSETGTTKRSVFKLSGPMSLNLISIELRLTSLPNQRHKLISSFLPILKSAKQRAGDHHRILLFHATHSHAEMFGFYHYRDSQWIKLFHDDRRYLIGQSFLNLQAARVDVDQTRQFGDAHDLVMRDVRHVCFAEKRQHVMFAKRKEVDIFLNDHLLVVFGEEGIVDDLCRIHVVTSGQES